MSQADWLRQGIDTTLVFTMSVDDEIEPDDEWSEGDGSDDEDDWDEDDWEDGDEGGDQDENEDDLF